MKIRTTLLILVLIATASFAVSLWAMPNLPEQIPVHWNAAGEVNGTAPRDTALWQMPATILVLGLLLLFLPKIDPLRKNIEQFRPAYHGLVLGMAVFFLYIHTLTLLAGLGVAFNMTYWMIPALAALMVGVGFLTERALPNWFIGIRTPWTLSSPSVWEKTHRLGGRTFKICGLLSLVGMVVPNEFGMTLALIPILFAALIPVIYSYILYRREQKP